MPEFANRMGMRQSRVVTLLVGGALIGIALLTMPPAYSHQPENEFFWWTCSGGKPSENNPGNCYQHHVSAYEDWHFGWVVPSWQEAIRHGAAQWDRTDGHEFDFIETTAGGSTVDHVFGPICENADAVGCTGMGAGSQMHSTPCAIQFLIGPTWNVDHTSSSFSGLDLFGVAAHEFGHCLGVDHSSNSFATMGGASSVNSTQARSLHYFDKRGRCQVYGHAHGWWGGCHWYGGY